MKPDAGRTAREALERAIDQLGGEVVLTKADVTRAACRGFLRLAGDLKFRAERLEHLRETLVDVREALRSKHG